ncbi:ABC transporter ATP-binding protein [Streptococcus pseudoporcinus]|uniref:Polysaccharide export system ATP-binding protein n=1 Tax=Streptococcus pseudoporcinus TaxID=361101 RepID=A0A4U9XLL1_9STRE|nr:ABC transporter ATP-binding protein [Streptococcus pseudoporcinus]VTS13655.1 polysaccharide export system ATP-binding protein [Streptococcus pseudoporcinus]VUC66718.1 polysaccharide export system ATP-binding protein [Streptococcus pseudoporcinus]VUC97648.1 polysaccharide export system ATP-binding protein [Streptococcus pseudoporcinus]VUC98039.1 polysaccharide export system ATP-binding protein [Streptococcus pseudoporcinus]
MTGKDIAVKVEHVSKSFKLPTEATKSFRTTLVNRFKGIKGFTEQKVLRDINFEVKKGDFFGIVGRNGSGKSTLLKIISQIYLPEKGQVTVEGKMVSFIELGVGFNPELTGRDNVYMNGAMLGFTTEEVDAMYDDIVSFAELHDFMNQKLKNYSSGMQVRLAFSVAIKAQGDVLILDEVLAVGDEAFQRKCNDYFMERKESGKTTILVTHDMGAVKKYCNRAVLIEDGLVKAYGEPDEVANQYSFDNAIVSENLDSNEDGNERTENSSKKSSLISDFSAKLLTSPQISPEDDITIEFSYNVLKNLNSHVALSFIDIDTNFGLYNDNSMNLHTSGPGKKVVTMTCKMPYLNHAKIKLAATVRDEEKHPLAFLPVNEVPLILINRKVDIKNESEWDANTGILKRNSHWK